MGWLGSRYNHDFAQYMHPIVRRGLKEKGEFKRILISKLCAYSIPGTQLRPVSILNQKFKECLLTCAFSWPIFFLNRFSFAKGQRTNKAIKRDIALTSNPYICNHLSNPVAFLSSAYFTFLLDRFSSSDSGFPSAESVID
jgi:hypothetical protein